MESWEIGDYLILGFALVAALGSATFPFSPRFKQAVAFSAAGLAVWCASAHWRYLLVAMLTISLIGDFRRWQAMQALKDALLLTPEPARAMPSLPVSAPVAIFLLTPLAAYMQLFGVAFFASEGIYRVAGFLPIDFGQMRPAVPETWNSSIADAGIRIYSLVWAVGWSVRLFKQKFVDPRQTMLFLRKFDSPYARMSREIVTPTLGAVGRVVTLFDESFGIFKPRDPLGVFAPLSGQYMRLDPPDDWRVLVRASIKWADTVVVELTEISENIRWELRLLAELKPRDRILLVSYFPIDGDTRREILEAGLQGVEILTVTSRQHLRDGVIRFAQRNGIMSGKSSGT